MAIKFDSKNYPLEDVLFSNIRYRIPDFQRPYSWTEDQIVDLWGDMISEEQSFFIGQFIFNYENFEKEKFVDVIDGQQRITTINILSSALRDVAKELGDENAADIIDEIMIRASKDFDGVKFRFTASPGIKTFFDEYIHLGKHDINLHELGEEENLVIKNYQILREKIVQHIGTEGTLQQKIEKIREIQSKIRKSQVILTKIFSEDDAFEIFETVNARGIDLSVADLLKNLLFRKIKAETGTIDDIQSKWLELKELLAEADVEITKFIRYYWLSKYSFVSEKNLFREIKKQNFSSYSDFLNDLYANAETLYALRTLEYKWEDLESGEKVRSALEGIRVLDVSQCNVLLLMLLRNYEVLPKGTARMIQVIEKFNYVYHSICKQPANRIEKTYHYYSKIIEEIVTGPEDKETKNKLIQFEYDKLTQVLRDLIPSKEYFIEGFKLLSYKKRDIARYTLSRIEENMGTEEKALNHPRLTIEHILPRNPGKDWGLTKSEIKSYADSIGNLTLLGKKNNSKIGNKSITDKIKILKDSTDINLTKEVLRKIEAGDQKWDCKKIEERTVELADLAYRKVWAI